MKAYWGSGETAPLIPWPRRAVSFTPRPFYSQGKSPWYSLDRWLVFEKDILKMVSHHKPKDRIFLGLWTKRQNSSNPCFNSWRRRRKFISTWSRWISFHACSGYDAVSPLQIRYTRLIKRRGKRGEPHCVTFLTGIPLAMTANCIQFIRHNAHILTFDTIWQQNYKCLTNGSLLICPLETE